MSRFAHLPAVLSEEILQRLVRAVRRAYAENQPLWNSGIGHDSQTFGLMLYKSIWHFLEEYLVGAPGVTCLRTSYSFEVHFGGLVVRSYKLGHSESDRIDDRYPSNVEATSFMALQNLEQLQLKLDEEVEPTYLVLGHQGNAVRGLAAVYLLAPLAHGAFYEWALVVRIDEPPAAASGAPLPEPKPIEPAPLRPRRKPSEELLSGSDD